TSLGAGSPGAEPAAVEQAVLDSADADSPRAGLTDPGGRGLVLRPIDDLGLPADSKEAYAFALLGFLTVHGLPATVPACTGARSAALLGSLTPGSGPLLLPSPAGSVPTRLRILHGGS